MGSNLKKKGSEKDAVWVVNSNAGMAVWLMRDAAIRKQLLDPSKTEVFDGGELPKGTSLTDAEKKLRGWGTVAKTSYGEWLVWLQSALDDCTASTEYGRKGVRKGLTEKAVAPGQTPLTEQEVALSYRYDLPVHAVGYNWLESNATSAIHLGGEIDRIMERYRKAGKRCEKVIVVTHSMGGLVTRHCSEVRGYKDKILGVVSSVMPATGSATAYRRVKAGWEGSGLARKVLGEDANEITAVFGQSPGPLQLLPDPEYGNGWLKIHDGSQFMSLPKSGDPYTEIYTQRVKWWKLIDDTLLNPTDKDNRQIEQNWAAYVILIKDHVFTFQKAISHRYHPCTYAFFGDDEKHKTFGDVVWKRTQVSSWWNDQKYAAMDLPTASDTYTGLIQVKAGKLGPIEIKKSFEVQPAEENGDGTVPIRSGRAPEKYAKACVPFTGVDHEGAYKPPACRLFALWAITRIVSNVKGTTMEYTQ